MRNSLVGFVACRGHSLSDNEGQVAHSVGDCGIRVGSLHNVQESHEAGSTDGADMTQQCANMRIRGHQVGVLFFKEPLHRLQVIICKSC